MMWKVREVQRKNSKDFIPARVGKEVYRHKDNSFVVLEFKCAGGRYQEAFRIEELHAV